MNYPLISEYVVAIKAAEDNFEQLKNLCPVLGEDGEPVMTSGNFAVVFKMKDEQTGKLHAVKCFLKEQEGRAEAYRQIAEELEYVSSTFLTPIKYLDKELFVDTNASDETEFPVLLMDWIEGQSLDKYIREHISDDFKLLYLSYQFSQFAMWLIPKPFAHGDLKPDNILVKEDGGIVLVDYDGMYVPAMKGQKARELGCPDFRHPNRTETDFDEHIDDFSLISIIVSLKAIAMQPDLLDKYGASDRLLFSQNDYKDICRCHLIKELYPSEDSELNVLLSLFTIALTKGNLANVSSNLFDLPKTSELIDEIVEAWAKAQDEEMAPYQVEKEWSFQDFAKDYKIMILGNDYCSFTGGGESACFFKKSDGSLTTVFNFENLNINQINDEENNLIIELRKSGHLVLNHSGIGKSIVSVEPCIIKKEVLDSFEGKEKVLHIISKNGEIWTTLERSFAEECGKNGACKLNTVDREKKHVLFLFNAKDEEVGRYYMGKKLQRTTPDQIVNNKSRLFFFESWNPIKKEWVPCIGIHN